MSDMGFYDEYNYDDPYYGYPDSQFLGDYSAYGTPQATDAATQGRMLSNLQKLNAILRDPSFNYRIATETGANTFPYEQLMQPGNPWLVDPTGLGGSGSSDDYDALVGMLTGGGGAGGGFGGGGGGGRSSAGTLGPRLLQASLNSSDPIMKEAATQLSEGLDPGTVMASIFKAVDDPDLRKMYNDQVGQMWQESGEVQMAQAGPGVGKPSELAKTAAKWGMVDPMSQWTGDTLPPEVEEVLNRYLPTDTDKVARNRAQQARVLERKAEYGPNISEPIGVLAPRGGQPVPLAGRGEQPTPLAPRATLPEGAARGLQPYGDRAAEPPPLRGPVALRAPATAAPVPMNTNQRDPTSGAFLFGFPQGTTLGAAAPNVDEEDGTGITARFARSRFLPQEPEEGEPSWTGKWMFSPEQNELRNNPRAPTVMRNGRQVRTNSAGARAAMMRGNAKQTAGQARSMEGQIREAAARRLNQSGRTPQTDQFEAQMRYLRQMGITV